MSSQALSRASLLYEAQRYEQAIDELRGELASEPDNDGAFALLALCQSMLDQDTDAFASARLAVSIDPNNAYPHQVLALVLHRAGRYADAERAALDSLNLNPYNVDAFGILGDVRLFRGNFKGALEAATSGLELQADDVTCNNVRTRALLKLNRKAEAIAAVDTTLSYEPDNAYSHANKGWTLLEAHKADEALVHFKEALRLQPGMDWARQGIVSGLKTKNVVYRVVFDYFMWTTRLTPPQRRGLVFGLWFAFQLVRVSSTMSPIMAKVAMVVVPVYVIFCFVSWTADPLMNMTLRLHPIGRYALTRRQTVEANWVTLSFCIALAFFLSYAGWHFVGGIVGGTGFLVVTYLIAVTRAGSSVGARRFLAVLTVLVAALILWAALFLR